MEFINLLQENLTEKFKRECILNGIGKEVCKIAKHKIDKIYKDKTINRDGHLYKFYSSHCSLYFHTGLLSLPEMDCRLLFIISEKISSHRNLAVENAKFYFERDGRTSWYNGKLLLWDDLVYRLSIDTAISDNINLLIK